MKKQGRSSLKTLSKPKRRVSSKRHPKRASLSGGATRATVILKAVSSPRSAHSDDSGHNASVSPVTARLKARLRLLEKRRHPRFLLSGEQFRELKSGKIFPVYDLSMSGLSVRIDEKLWKEGEIIKGVLNLHPDSIEISARVLSYYGDRAALKIEMASTYTRGILQKALHPKRLGTSLKLIREKLPFADFWFHGACNTDLLVKLDDHGGVHRAEVFFSNFYWSWSTAVNGAVIGDGSDSGTSFSHSVESPSLGICSTGVCQSIGRERREDMLLAEEPVLLEMIQLARDSDLDPEKMRWAKNILETAPLEPRLKDFLLKQFKTE